MPTADAILAQLAQIAEAGFELAFVLHVAAAGAVAMLLAGWRPGRRTVGMLAAAPLATASGFAWIFENPFNGAALGLLALALMAFALRAPREPSRPGPAWAVALGLLAMGFALVYPHFLAGHAALAYLVAAPVGLIPCPSLALAAGIFLVAGAPAGRTAAALLAGVGAFYAVFGMLRLGVWLDAGLLGAAAALPFLALRAAPPLRLRPG